MLLHHGHVGAGDSREDPGFFDLRKIAFDRKLVAEFDDGLRTSRRIPGIGSPGEPSDDGSHVG